MNWKEQFEERFAGVIGHPLHAKIPMEDFISTEIIEKLIEDTELLIAEVLASRKYPIEDCVMISEIVAKQIKDKWL